MFIHRNKLLFESVIVYDISQIILWKLHHQRIDSTIIICIELEYNLITGSHLAIKDFSEVYVFIIFQEINLQRLNYYSIHRHIIMFIHVFESIHQMLTMSVTNCKHDNLK